MGEESDISKLLRLKRYEQPPPGYFDDFLHEFRRRQRAELLKQPMWQELWGRIMSMAPTFRVPQMAYATIVACAIAASVMIMERPVASTMTASAKPEASSLPAFTLTSSKPVTISEAIPVATQLPPHFVLQPRPVSNEQPLSF
ncbi:hypothetical protein BH09VER1_BH09VER1_37180 [soil metagenome]